jgi:hypothetical protein
MDCIPGSHVQGANRYILPVCSWVAQASYIPRTAGTTVLPICVVRVTRVDGYVQFCPGDERLPDADCVMVALRTVDRSWDGRKKLTVGAGGGAQWNQTIS